MLLLNMRRLATTVRSRGIWSAADSVPSRKGTVDQQLRSIRRYTPLYAMMLIPLLWFVVFQYLPMYGIVISFKNYNISKGLLGSPWVSPWYKHFARFFTGPYFFSLLRNTLLISLFRLVFGIFPPIFLALLLNESRYVRFNRLIQTLTYMPHFLSWAIIFGISYAFLSGTTGLVNRIIVQGGGRAVNFLSSTGWFRPIIVLTGIWQSWGWGAIIYLAAIAGINPDLYSAAKIDGASRPQMAVYITIPSITNVIVLLLILRLGRIMNAGFEQIYIFYNVHVYEVADIIDTWVFRTGLEQMNYSLGTAVGLFKSVIGMAMVMSSNSLARRFGKELW